MKQLLLLTVLIFLFLQSSAQQTMTTEKVRYGTWNVKTKEWIYTDTKPYTVRFTFQRSTILVNDETRSVYTLGKVKEEYDDERTYRKQWEATDESGKYCVVTVAWRKKDGQIFYTIAYMPGFIIQYDMKETSYIKD